MVVSLGHESVNFIVIIIQCCSSQTLQLQSSELFHNLLLRSQIFRDTLLLLLLLWRILPGRLLLHLWYNPSYSGLLSSLILEVSGLSLIVYLLLWSCCKVFGHGFKRMVLLRCHVSLLLLPLVNIYIESHNAGALLVENLFEISELLVHGSHLHVTHFNQLERTIDFAGDTLALNNVLRA